jgi:hypothetical protein
MAENGAKKNGTNRVTLVFSGDDKTLYEKLLADAKANRRDLDQQILLELAGK